MISSTTINLSRNTLYREVSHCIYVKYKSATVFIYDRSCALVVRIPGYRSRSLGLIPGATRFSEK
jgi:hypothetical protein